MTNTRTDLVCEECGQVIRGVASEQVTTNSSDGNSTRRFWIHVACREPRAERRRREDLKILTDEYRVIERKGGGFTVALLNVGFDPGRDLYPRCP
jgi:hypothetical protein